LCRDRDQTGIRIAPHTLARKSARSGYPPGHDRSGGGGDVRHVAGRGHGAEAPALIATNVTGEDWGAHGSCAWPRAGSSLSRMSPGPRRSRINPARRTTRGRRRVMAWPRPARRCRGRARGHRASTGAMDHTGSATVMRRPSTGGRWLAACPVRADLYRSPAAACPAGGRRATPGPTAIEAARESVLGNEGDAQPRITGCSPASTLARSRRMPASQRS
jgi:hypothetical protein